MPYKVHCLNRDEGIAEPGSELERHIDQKKDTRRHALNPDGSFALMPDECAHCVDTFRRRGSVTPEGIAKMHPFKGFMLQSRYGRPV